METLTSPRIIRKVVRKKPKMSIKMKEEIYEKSYHIRKRPTPEVFSKEIYINSYKVKRRMTPEQKEAILEKAFEKKVKRQLEECNEHRAQVIVDNLIIYWNEMPIPKCCQNQLPFTDMFHTASTYDFKFQFSFDFTYTEESIEKCCNFYFLCDVEISLIALYALKENDHIAYVNPPNILNYISPQLEETFHCSRNNALVIESDDCPVCFETLDENLVGKCGHQICIPCLKRISKSNNVSCPLCRQSYEEMGNIIIGYNYLDTEQIEDLQSTDEGVSKLKEMVNMIRYIDDIGPSKILDAHWCSYYDFQYPFMVFE